MRIADRLIDRRLRLREVLETQPAEIISYLYNTSIGEAEAKLKEGGYLTVDAGDKFESGEVRVYRAGSNGADGSVPYIFLGIEDKLVTVVAQGGAPNDSMESVKGNVRKVRRTLESN